MWWHHGVWCCGGVEDEWCLFVLFCLFCCCGKVYVCLCECVCVSRGCLGWACTKPPPPAPTTSPPLFRILLNDIICVLCFVFVFCVLCFLFCFFVFGFVFVLFVSIACLLAFVVAFALFLV